MNISEGIDWYVDPDTGSHVWTSKFLIDRGYCCNGNCRHCPYDESGFIKSEFIKILSSSMNDAQ